MYLIRVNLDIASRETRNILADCQKMHSFLTGLFGTTRKDSNILYRVNSAGHTVRIYIYASGPVPSEAVEKYAIEQKDISAWLKGIADGSIWNFDMLVVPSKKAARPDGGLSQRRLLKSPEERQHWMSEKGNQHGFRIIDLSEQNPENISGFHRKENGGALKITAYHYQGALQVTDAEAFHAAIAEGIGPEKAYGCGMLLLK